MNDLVVVAGEFSIDPPELFAALEAGIPDLVRQVIRDTGYAGGFPDIDPDRCELRLQLNRQSDDVGRGVEQGDEVLGAGDQSLVLGYASDETPEPVPLPLLLAHRLVERQAEPRKSGELAWLRPDAKSQVSVRNRDEQPMVPESLRAAGFRRLVNPTGRFVIGGPGATPGSPSARSSSTPNGNNG